MEPYVLRQRQSLPLEAKIVYSQQKIREWYEHWYGQVYVSFSGGKDSTVLLHLVRSIYPDVPAVFVDTGLEYPEIRQFVRTIDNVVWLRPKIPFNQVIREYGYPVVSKENARKIHEMQAEPTEKNRRTRELRLGKVPSRNGKYNVGVLPEKWRFLINAPFKVNDACCDVMKKRPFKQYEKKTGQMPILGTMASEGRFRENAYLRNGCNAFSLKRPASTPIAFWNEDNIWDYLRQLNIPYSDIYDMGYERTGCMFCMFGVHLEKGENRFQRMKRTHPAQWRYCMTKLGLAKVLDYIGVDYGKQQSFESVW